MFTRASPFTSVILAASLGQGRKGDSLRACRRETAALQAEASNIGRDPIVVPGPSDLTQVQAKTDGGRASEDCAWCR